MFCPAWAGARKQHRHAVTHGLLDHDHRVGPAGDWRACGDADAMAVRQVVARRIPRVDGVDERQGHRRIAARTAGVGGDDGVPVHGGACEGRHVDGRIDVVGEHPAGEIAQRDPFRARDWTAACRKDRARLSDRDDRAIGPQRHQRRASRTRCPSSGSSSFCIARRTAASDPGIAITIVALARPAHARLNIAAGPTSA